MIDVREHSESLLGSDDAPWENCTLLLVTIANVTSVFERCALMRSRPFTMCESCVNEYGVAVRIFDQLQKNLTDPTMKLCKDEFFSSAKFSVVYKTIVHIRDLWQSASCAGCFERQLSSDGGYTVSNDTIIFNRKLHEMNECVNRSESESKNRTNLCIICDGPYRDLNRFYNGLVRASKDGNICFDMVDAMNATRMLWSSHLCSVHQYSNTPSLIVAGVVGLLVVLFYAGAGLVINPLNTELVPRMVEYCQKYAKGIVKVSQSFGPVPSYDGPTLDKVNKELVEKIPVKDLPKWRKWRDMRLAALAKLKKDA
ncbi:hypothetical protein HPB47_010431 [Ixodes persulcatus]|uniref:Uncharacterized protein n=1 Tax=Ixodes persulcatus TaxID=34615 RepID=A0AC60NZ45_IXOPE|nr:hypothetical protein HPB47_010431 [Ixodes persulcatus]